jgi:uroporphyrinogen-III synthase
MKVKKILVSQPPPENGKSPYFELAENNNLSIDFRPFIHVEGISAKVFRQERIDILKHSAVIFTSKTAVDHFFRISEDLRLTVPDTMKYFCISEATAYYLQKYIVYRKRKIFYGNGQFQDLMDLINKHRDESFLVPLSDLHKEEIPKTLKEQKIRFTKAILYRTVCSDLSDLSLSEYDMLVFFSPSGIKSLIQNFPDFKQNHIKIASFGSTTACAVEDAGFRLDVKAPMPDAPSMTMALDNFIKEHNKNSARK